MPAQQACGLYTIRVVKRVEVSVNPNRNFHNVSACRAPNGDFLVSHQDSLRHGGGDCFLHRWRSRDEGLTWQDEGAAADLRKEGLDARAGELGVTPDGRMVMIVQRVDPKGDGGNSSTLNNTWYASSDSRSHAHPLVPTLCVGTAWERTHI
ncbi:MAG: hypothetical protein J7M27_08015 [Candidatus Latescibacteria bacterium]|nr:hypothetical protein [Candidatus Latescibacterota bacterium]